MCIRDRAYAEVMIPRWSNLIPKDYPIKQLEKEGLDIQIAYRIPTEGKQSVSVVKVVGVPVSYTHLDVYNRQILYLETLIILLIILKKKLMNNLLQIKMLEKMLLKILRILKKL